MLPLLLAGCQVESTWIRGPEPGKNYLVLRCGGGMVDCWQEAGRICGTLGWRPVERVDSSGAVVFAGSGAAVVAPVDRHEMIVRCGPFPTPAAR